MSDSKMFSPKPPFCPYKGLSPYEEADVRYFFGRATDSRIIAGSLLARRLTVLFGASGLGKTSLLNAGVFPLVRHARGQVPIYTNRFQSADFLERLTDSIRARLTAPVAETIRLPDLAAAWAADPCSRPPEITKVEVTDDCAPRRATPLMLVLDQFEEFFNYPAGPREGFTRQLAELVNRRDLDVRVLIALRDDRLALLDRLSSLIPDILSNRVELTALDQASARAACRGPIDRYNEPGNPERGTEPTVEIHDDLIDQVLEGAARDAEVGTGAAARYDTAYLQLALTKVWVAEPKPLRALRAKTLQTLGGSSGIAERHLGEVLADLTADEAFVCGRFFEQLVGRDGAKRAQPRHVLRDAACLDTDKPLGRGLTAVFEGFLRFVIGVFLPGRNPDRPLVPVPWRDRRQQRRFAELAAGRPPRVEIDALLARLAQASTFMLRTVPSPGRSDEPAYEIFHDVLGKPIQAWTARFRETLALARAYRARILAMAVATAMGVLALISVGFASYALVQRGEARDRLEHANALKAASGLWNQLEFRSDQLTPDERDALWTIAAGNESGRKAFIDLLESDRALASPYARGKEHVERALGLGWTSTAERARVEAVTANAVIFAMGRTTIPAQLLDLAQALPVLQPALEGDSAASALRVLWTALEAAQTPAGASDLARAVQAIAAHAHPADAAATIASLLRAIDAMNVLGRYERPESKETESIAQAIAALGKAIQPLTARVPAGSLQLTTLQGIQIALDAIDLLGKDNEDELTTATRLMAVHLPLEEAENAFTQAIAMVDRTTTNTRVSRDLAQVALSLAPLVSDGFVRSWRQNFIAFEAQRADPKLLAVIFRVLRALPGELSDLNAASLFEAMLARIRSAARDEDRLTLARAIGDLPIALTETQSQTLLDAFAARDAAPAADGESLQTDTPELVAAIAPKLAAPVGIEAFDAALAEVLQPSWTVSEDEVAAAVALAPHADAARARQSLIRLVDAIANHRTDQKLDAYGRIAMALAPRLGAAQSDQTLAAAVRTVARAVPGTLPTQVVQVIDGLPMPANVQQLEAAFFPVIAQARASVPPGALSTLAEAGLAAARSGDVQQLQPILTAIATVIGPDQLDELTSLVAAQMPNLYSWPVRPMADALRAALVDPSAIEPTQRLAALVLAWGDAFTAGLNVPDVGTPIKLALSKLGRNRLPSLLRALQMMPIDVAEAENRRVAHRLLDALASSGDRERTLLLSDLLAMMPGPSTAEDARRVDAALAAEAQRTNQPQVLREIARHMRDPRPPDSAAARQVLARIVELAPSTTTAADLSILVDAALLLAEALNPDQVIALRRALLDSLDDPAAGELGDLASAMRSLPGPLDPALGAEAQAALLRQAEGILQSWYTGAGQPISLTVTEAVAALKVELTDEQSETWRRLLAVGGESPTTFDSQRIAGRELANLGPWLQDEQAAAELPRAEAGLALAVDPTEAEAWAAAIAGLAHHEQDGAYLSRLVRALKMPTATGPATIELLRAVNERFPDAPSFDRGVHDFLIWLQINHPNLSDLADPPAHCPASPAAAQIRACAADAPHSQLGS